MSIQDHKDIWIKAGRPSVWEFLMVSALAFVVIISVFELLDSYRSVTDFANIPADVVGQMIHNYAKDLRIDWIFSVVAASVLVPSISKIWAVFKRRRKLLKASETQDSTETSQCSPSK